uniref:SPOR domain-containing protein n=1 Tax=uncultured Flavobacteriia bacterium TaxID=212695 RepID=F4MMW5_9BACT|nr:hypothetical protein [uncultured bacterium]CBL87478.1 hypothetical protein S18_870_0001 [uncultured Flavobacteriia bacterium]
MPGSIVDQFGVTLSDELRLNKKSDVASRKYANFYNENEIKRSDYKNVNEFLIAKANAFNKAFNLDVSEVISKDYYRVKLGEYYEKVPATLINKYLSIEDLISIPQDNGSVVYAVGSYENVNDAVDRQTNLETDDLDNTQIIIDKKGIIENYNILNENIKKEEISINNDSIEIENSKNDVSKEKKQKDIIINDLESKLKSIDNKLVYRIQIGAFEEILPKEIFKGVNDVVFFKGDDNVYRYNSGAFNNYQQAIFYLKEMRDRGFEDAFIATYKGGKRVGLSNVLSSKNKTSIKSLKKDITNQESKISTNEENIFYSIQIGIFSDNISAEKLKVLSQLKSLKTTKINDKLSSYFIDKIATIETAKKKLSNIKSKGFEKAFIIKTRNGKRVPLAN